MRAYECVIVSMVSVVTCESVVGECVWCTWAMC